MAGLQFLVTSHQSVAAQTDDRRLLGFAAAYPRTYDQTALLAAHGFSWLTPENAMKMDTISGCNGSFNFGPADELISIAKDLGMTVHGHTLVWHSQTSWCVDQFSQADFVWYVQSVTSHFCGRVASMDVVNEALGRSAGFRSTDESVWARLFQGNDYIQVAFRAAREACPQMKLYYNDFGIEWGRKSREMLGLVSELNREGLIDGVGFQAHFHINKIDYGRFARTMDAVIDMGLEVAISELDVRFGRNYWDLSESDLTAQASVYSRIAQLCLERPQCKRFTVWGLDDGTSWVNYRADFGAYDDAPLLFDRNWLPKPAYCTGVRPVFDLPTGNC